MLKSCPAINMVPTRPTVFSINIQTDHVHLLVQLPPNVSVSKVVQTFKGGTGRRIREEFPELEEFLWGESLWAIGFFAESVGQVTEARIKLYIKNR